MAGKFRRGGNASGMTVNTTANIKRAGVKRAIKKGGRVTGRVLGKTAQWILNIFLTLLLIGAISGGLLAFRFYDYIRTYLVEEDYDIENLKVNLDQTTKIFYFNENGTPVELEDQRIYGTENRSWVSYESMPKKLVDAFLAIEDERFWTNSGVDWKRTFGAVLQFAGGNDSYGGSTITQQLIKNITKEDETTIQRKIKEIFRALSLTKKHTKFEIVEMYLNTINLSRGNYGVQAAANYYFGKDVSELTLVECAALASIPKSPTKYDPIRNPDFNKDRRETVLDKMLELGWITEEEHNAAVAEDLVINVTALNGTVTASNSFFKDALIEELIADLGEQYGYSREYASNIVYSGGLEIYATVDPEIQTIMEDVFFDPATFQRVSDGIQPESAMVLIDPATGDVKGLVGGREKTQDRELNRATQSKRQIGSSIKPITVYAPAMDLGLINYATVIDDTPVQLLGGRYWPVNAPNRYDGLTTVNRAIELSKNTVAVKVLKMMGIDYAYRFAKEKIHLDSLEERDKNLASLALGGLTYGLTVKEVAAAYTMFPNQGVYTYPRLYTKVLRSDGTVLLEKPVRTEQAITADTAQVMTKMMQNAVTRGTAAAISLDTKINIAGKTGSTNEEKDRFFAGFTPYYVGAAWFGYDTPRNLGRFSSNPAMLAWEKVMARVHQKYFDRAAAGIEPLKTFDYSRLTTAAFCLDSGLRPGANCARDLRGGRTSTGYFARSQLPTKECTTHILVDWDSTTGQVATPYCPKDAIMQVAFVNVEDRSFVGAVAIGDAAYTARAGAGNFEYAGEGGAYYASTMANGTTPGFTAGMSTAPNSYCVVHRSPESTDVPEIGEEGGEVTGETGESGETVGTGETGESGSAGTPTVPSTDAPETPPVTPPSPPVTEQPDDGDYIEVF